MLARVLAVIVCPSVCPSHAGIVSKRLIVWGSRKHRNVIAAGTLSFLTQIVVGGRRLILPDICAQSDSPPFRTERFRPISAHSALVPQPWELAKNVQLTLIGSRPRAFQRATDEPSTLPLSPPKGGTKRDFAVFASKIQFLLKDVCCKVSSCENFQRQSCSYIISLFNGPRTVGDIPIYLTRSSAIAERPAQRSI